MSGWSVAMPVGGLLVILVDMGRPRLKMGALIFWVWNLDCIRAEKERSSCHGHPFFFSAPGYRYDWLLQILTALTSLKWWVSFQVILWPGIISQTRPSPQKGSCQVFQHSIRNEPKPQPKNLSPKTHASVLLLLICLCVCLCMQWGWGWGRGRLVHIYHGAHVESEDKLWE